MVELECAQYHYTWDDLSNELFLKNGAVTMSFNSSKEIFNILKPFSINAPSYICGKNKNE